MVTLQQSATWPPVWCWLLPTSSWTSGTTNLWHHHQCPKMIELIKEIKDKHQVRVKTIRCDNARENWSFAEAAKKEKLLQGYKPNITIDQILWHLIQSICRFVQTGQHQLQMHIQAAQQCTRQRFQDVCNFLIPKHQWITWVSCPLFLPICFVLFFSVSL